MLESEVFERRIFVFIGAPLQVSKKKKERPLNSFRIKNCFVTIVNMSRKETAGKFKLTLLQPRIRHMLKVQSCSYVFQKYPKNFPFQLFIILQ